MIHSTNLTADGSRLFPSNCRQKVGHVVSKAIERESSTTFNWKIVISMMRSITLRADTKILLPCYPGLGSDRTIISNPKQPSFVKIAALVFHSTNWTTDGSILFFLVVFRKKFHQDKIFCSSLLGYMLRKNTENLWWMRKSFSEGFGSRQKLILRSRRSINC